MDDTEPPDDPLRAASQSAPVVTISDLHVRRGKTEVIPGLTLQIPAGQVVGLLGPSGCGKSTLMRSIVGVQRVRRGVITVLGLPAGSAPLRHRLGYVTQVPSVYEDLTVSQNLHYFRRIVGAPVFDVERVLDQTDLSDMAHRLVGTLSGGQRGRVSLAVAILGSPELLILDEPTVGLDPLLRVELWDLFHALSAAGTSLLISSHVMDEATRCQRLLLMREGAVLANTTPTGLLEMTATTTAEDAFLALIKQRARHLATADTR